MKATDISNPEYFHKVVDCQHACPAHTPVPEYIRLIGQRRFTDAYMVNWESNVFPGILGRTCDRPCEPACRRDRVETEPVAICRLKRVAADHKDDGDVASRLPAIPAKKNGRKIALIGAGPASLTVARDLMPLGYEIDLYDENAKGGGFMRSQIPSFRLPEEVLDQEIGYVTDMGVTTIYNHYVDSMAEILGMSPLSVINVTDGWGEVGPPPPPLPSPPSPPQPAAKQKTVNAAKTNRKAPPMTSRSLKKSASFGDQVQPTTSTPTEPIPFCRDHVVDADLMREFAEVWLKAKNKLDGDILPTVTIDSTDEQFSHIQSTAVDADQVEAFDSMDLGSSDDPLTWAAEFGCTPMEV